jgi:anti-anti-sigma factor
MAQPISPEFGNSAGDAHAAFSAERGRLELDMPAGSGFGWEVADGVLRTQFHGEICAWSVARLQPVLLSLLADLQPWAIVVDMSAVTFFDASATNLLIQARQLAADQGATLSLESPSRFVRRVLALCELDDEFAVS